MTLDTRKTYSRYDQDNIMYGIDRLPEQMRSAWTDTRELSLASNYGKVESVLVAGMGGSALGADMLKVAAADKLKVPLEIIRGYDLPKYVGPKTLVILSSFSGTTEEALSAAAVAKARHAKMVAICAGGTLASWAKKNKIPAYIFTPGELAKQPRLGLGFSMIGVLGILERAGLIKISDKDIEQMAKAMNDVIGTCSVDVPEAENPAKAVAAGLKGRSALIVSSEHLHGNAHTLSNQINETGKQLAIHLDLPELDHHFLEGLSHPVATVKNITALMLRSKLYHPRTQKRYDITAELFERQGLTVIDYEAQGQSRLEECAELLQFGSYVSYYLAMLNKVNPESIPFVDEFKRRMSE